MAQHKRQPLEEARRQHLEGIARKHQTGESCCRFIASSCVLARRWQRSQTITIENEKVQNTHTCTGCGAVVSDDCHAPSADPLRALHRPLVQGADSLGWKWQKKSII
jgi:hypothetical protein